MAQSATSSRLTTPWTNRLISLLACSSSSPTSTTSPYSYHQHQTYSELYYRRSQQHQAAQSARYLRNPRVHARFGSHQFRDSIRVRGGARPSLQEFEPWRFPRRNGTGHPAALEHHLFHTLPPDRESHADRH